MNFLIDRLQTQSTLVYYKFCNLDAYALAVSYQAEHGIPPSDQQIIMSKV